MEKIKLSGVPATTILTVYARAKASQGKKAVLHDQRACEILDKVEMDFSKAQRDSMMGKGTVARTLVLDELVRDFLRIHPKAPVLNLACGLDTRPYRLGEEGRRWIHLDLPEVIDLRRKLLGEKEGLLAYSVTDPAWPDRLSFHEEILVIVEGLTMYLKEEEVFRMLFLIGKAAPKGTLFLEFMHPFVVRHVKEKSVDALSATFTWGVTSGREIGEKSPGFHWAGDVDYREGMRKIDALYPFYAWIPPLGNLSNKIGIFTWKREEI